MKNLYSALIALAILGAVSTMDARCRRGACAPKVTSCNRCEQPKPSPCEAPKVTERCWIVQEPCRKMICVDGTCDHKVTERCVTTQSKKCIGGCKAFCANAANPADRGEDATGELEVVDQQ